MSKLQQCKYYNIQFTICLLQMYDMKSYKFKINVYSFPILFSVNGQTLKYVSLVTLTLQNALVGLSMRYARTRSGDLFLSSTGK